MISAFEQYFTSLKGKKIAVLGLGVSNRPLVRLLLEFVSHYFLFRMVDLLQPQAKICQLQKRGHKFYLLLIQ